MRFAAVIPITNRCFARLLMPFPQTLPRVTNRWWDVLTNSVLSEQELVTPGRIVIDCTACWAPSLTFPSG
jgi:hypothetical protein